MNPVSKNREFKQKESEKVKLVWHYYKLIMAVIKVHKVQIDIPKRYLKVHSFSKQCFPRSSVDKT
jgi:hypothetical protein